MPSIEQIEPTIPVIDLTSQEDEIVSKLRYACTTSGFFQIVNHGISSELQKAVFDAAQKVFALPREEKLKVEYSKHLAKRGWETGQHLEETAQVDDKEGFYFGKDLPLDDPRVRAGKFGHGPNNIPENVPGFDSEKFRSTLTTYWDTIMPLAQRLMRYLALSLSLPKNYFDEILLNDAYGLIRLLHYPPTPKNASPSFRGAGAHTDFGNITLLMQDNTGGLEVWDNISEEGGWMKVKPVPGAYVVNLGDAIGRWTNQKYKSTVHRVINAGGEGVDRYSVPFFFSGNLDCTIQCIPTCLDKGEEPKYPPIKLEDHYRERYATTYGRTAKVGNIQ